MVVVSLMFLFPLDFSCYSFFYFVCFFLICDFSFYFFRTKFVFVENKRSPKKKGKEIVRSGPRENKQDNETKKTKNKQKKEKK